ncbi:SlyX protein [Caviibacterium pharyngocola]|uniref:SlyX protein n=1 Tax=Caviibacterium pharyngocola TaxID=28159 RepID=A0A2M8RSV2_9PAST|nr:SlyX protein [Caviibacterium pharyngocola]PJG81968.1 SlyX protein [Caviibacterium pharyngocola]
MSNLRVLPKKAYSISDVVRYITINHHISLSERDILEYIQNGDLQASIFLQGNINEITAINRKTIPKKEHLGIRKSNIFIKINQAITDFQVSYFGDELSYEIKANNHLFDLNIYLDSRYYLASYFSENNIIQLFSGETDKFKRLTFTSYFNLPKHIFENQNTDNLLESKVINYFPNISIAEKDGIYLSIPVAENKTKILLDDICILHEDVLRFLEMFSVIDSESNLTELQKLNEEINKKNQEINALYQKTESQKITIEQQAKEINNLKIAASEENRPILLGAYREKDPLKIAIDIRRKYWANYPENVKTDTQITNNIVRDYQVKRTFAKEIEKIACPIDRRKNKS